MLKQVSVRNFKLFDTACFELRPISVLVGPGGSGKSTLLDALSMLAQSAGYEGLVLEGPRMSAVGFEDLVHKHESRRIMEFELMLDFEGAFPPISDGPSHRLEYTIAFDAEGFREQRAFFSFSPDRALEFRTPRNAKWTIPPPLQLVERPRVTFGGSTYTLLPFRFTVEGRDYPLHRALNTIRRELLGFFSDNLHIVPSQRVMRASVYEDEGARERHVWYSLGEMVSALRQSWDTRDKASHWLHQVTGRRVNFVKTADAIRVEASNGVLHSVMCEGEGVRQLIWPLAALASAEPGSLVAIEEPEIHLHPEAQARLARLLVELATGEDRHLLLTTHSEHIVMAFLTSVATGDLPLDDLCIYYLREEGGACVVERLTIDEMGMAKGGLKGFFEAGLEELGSYLQAISTARPKLTDEA